MFVCMGDASSLLSSKDMTVIICLAAHHIIAA